jgi:hypothetical protein
VGKEEGGGGSCQRRRRRCYLRKRILQNVRQRTHQNERPRLSMGAGTWWRRVGNADVCCIVALGQSTGAAEVPAQHLRQLALRSSIKLLVNGFLHGGHLTSRPSSTKVRTRSNICTLDIPFLRTPTALSVGRPRPEPSLARAAERACACWRCGRVPCTEA